MSIGRTGNEAAHREEERGRTTEAARPSVLVVGVDGSAAASAALRWAAREARRTGARVLAIAVSEPQPLLAGNPGVADAATPGLAGGGYGVLDDDERNAKAQRWLSEAIAPLPDDAGALVEPRVVHGDAADALLEAARGADLLVLGNHREGALTGALLGSVAQHCMRHSEGPLVLVPAKDPPPHPGDR